MSAHQTSRKASAEPSKWACVKGRQDRANGKNAERSLDADLALALTLSGRELLREGPPLKVLPMSATLEGERLAALLGDASVVRSEGRMYPVDIQWGRAAQPGEALEPRVVQTVLQALAEQGGSLLVFLPGQAEIRRVQAALEENLDGRADVLLCPLHGELDLAAQRAAIEPAPAGTRKVVLATNIAETSLTIDGVRVVVDAGLERVPRFDPASGMTRLDTQRISRASATQRAGRAGRLQPGCATACGRRPSTSSWPPTPAPRSSRPIWPASPCSWRAGVSTRPASWSGSTRRRPPRWPRPASCCSDSARWSRAARAGR